MTYYGMNIQAIEQVADQFKVEADTVTRLRKYADSNVERLQSSWRGPDADRFIGEWQMFSRSALESVREQLLEMSSRAQHQAYVQRRTSQN